MIKKSKEKDIDKTKTKAETRQKESDKATFLKQDKKTKQNYISCQKKGVSSLSKRNDQEIKRKRY